MRKPFIQLILFISALSTAAAATAGEALDRLNRFYRDVDSLKAEFEQRLFDAEGEQVQDSAGSVAIKRPDRFRWDYREPYPQLLIGDGRRVWVYDPELEQVTVRPMERAVGNAPALVLSGRRPLEEDFAITEQGRREGLVWVELRPRAAESDFKVVRIGFGRTLERLELVDSFDQVSQIRFINLERNPDLDPSLFQFEVPEGVEVVGEGV